MSVQATSVGAWSGGGSGNGGASVVADLAATGALRGVTSGDRDGPELQPKVVTTSTNAAAARISDWISRRDRYVHAASFAN